jgi:hypothetical protein
MEEAWLTDGSSGAVFVDTGLDIVLNEVGGRDVLQPFDVYGAEVPAGTYILVEELRVSGTDLIWYLSKLDSRLRGKMRW